NPGDVAPTTGVVPTVRHGNHGSDRRPVCGHRDLLGHRRCHSWPGYREVQPAPSGGAADYPTGRRTAIPDRAGFDECYGLHILPPVLFPLIDMGTMEEIAASYAGTVIFLVMGGVILGLATEKSNLHLRVALLTIRLVGTKPSQIVLGLMIASAFISAWVSNTAT